MCKFPIWDGHSRSKTTRIKKPKIIVSENLNAYFSCRRYIFLLPRLPSNLRRIGSFGIYSGHQEVSCVISIVWCRVIFIVCCCAIFIIFLSLNVLIVSSSVFISLFLSAVSVHHMKQLMILFSI